MNTAIISESTAVSMINTEQSFKPYSKLTLADDFVFGKIFQNKAQFKRLLEILLHLPADVDIAEPITQKLYRVAPDRKRITTDVSASSATAEYDVEMQQQVRPGLAMRSRYYQAAMDVHFLQSGSDYTQLKENYIVFICLQDPFGMQLPVYTFQNICQEQSGLTLADGTTKVFYNAKEYAKLKDKEMRSFMEYISTNKATSPYTATLDEMIEDLRSNPLWSKEYLSVMQEELLQKRKEENIRKETKLEAARNCKLQNIAPELIAKITGLSLDEILAL